VEFPTTSSFPTALNGWILPIMKWGGDRNVMGFSAGNREKTRNCGGLAGYIEYEVCEGVVREG
jgi:hypothetical protein